MSANVSVPSTARGKPGEGGDPSGSTSQAAPSEAVLSQTKPQPRRTAPLSVIVGVLSSVQNAIIPAIAAGASGFASSFGGSAIAGGLFILMMVAGTGSVFAYIRWKRLTYTIGEQDIRVESGVLSRSARSVPFERIQDVSLEQRLLPRLLGLVAVKFETGAGGADDLALAYLAEAEGERLRELVRERRDAVPGSQVGSQANGQGSLSSEASAPAQRAQPAETLFTMGPRRLFTFGLFEFSLAVFAVLGGLVQYLDWFFDIEIWDFDFWRDLAEEQGGWLFELGAYGQTLSAIAGLITVFVIGSATGLARTFSREWGFALERTARGFRRRRGLFTRTDVVMPVHRVQGLILATGFVRYRFGWHGLRFVSLAQDAGSASHVVAPFAQLEELDPIVRAAGFALPDADAEWHRATLAYRNVSLVIDAVIFAVIALIAGIATYINAPGVTPWVVGGILAFAGINAIANVLSWRFKRHALENDQIVAVSGILAPVTRIATRVKLHSVEIAQGPFARKFGYATLHLGMAGGEYAIRGLDVERAHAVRKAVLETIAATDFSQLENAYESQPSA